MKKNQERKNSAPFETGWELLIALALATENFKIEAYAYYISAVSIVMMFEWFLWTSSLGHLINHFFKHNCFRRWTEDISVQEWGFVIFLSLKSNLQLWSRDNKMSLIISSM